MNWRLWMLLAVLAAITVIVFLFPAIPQSETYHHFADTRTFAGIPNALDVLSNAFFLIVGLLGVRYVLRVRKTRAFPDSWIRASAGRTSSFFWVSR